MNKFYYIANIRLPTEKAHGIQIMKTCEALARSGIDIELVVPRRKNPIDKNAFEYYDVSKSFRIKYLWCLDLVMLGRVGFWIETITFTKMVAFYVLFEKGIFYTRDESIALYLKLLGKKIIWEVHMGQKNFFTRMLIRLKARVVSISKGLRDLYIDMGVDPEDICVIPDGVDLNLFNININREEARRILGLEGNNKLIVYTGSLYPWKGVDILNEASKFLKDGRVLIVTDKPHKEIPIYLKSADILVLPNSAKEEISKTYTSPMKLFEYMSSGVPIVASDVPAVREILDEESCYFFTPDDSQSLVQAIDRCLIEGEEAKDKSLKALENVGQYTWNKRAQRILEFIK